MSIAAKKKFVEEYRGYEIMFHKQSEGYGTSSYYIYKQKEQISDICLISLKAAKNVIDTHERYILEQQKLNQR